MLWPKKNSYKEFANEKKFPRFENSPPPPHNFSNGPSLTEHHTNHKSQIGHALHSSFFDFVALGDLT